MADRPDEDRGPTAAERLEAAEARAAKAQRKADQLQCTLDAERGVHVATIMGLQDGAAYRDAVSRIDRLAAELEQEREAHARTRSERDKWCDR